MLKLARGKANVEKISRECFSGCQYDSSSVDCGHTNYDMGNSVQRQLITSRGLWLTTRARRLLVLLMLVHELSFAKIAD